MNRSTMTPLFALPVALMFAAGCGGGRRDVVPRLPGEGSEHTATPRAPGAGPDLWAGRDLIDPPRPIAPRPVGLPPVERFALGNGLQVIAVESLTAPTFSIQLAVKSGRRSEPREKIGLSSFVASMLPKGARGRSGAQITAALEQVGAQVTSNASFEAMLVSCQAPASGQATCLKAVGDMVAAPSFPAAAMDDVREQLVSAALQQQADLAQLANLHFQNALWGDEHVRGTPLSQRSVAAIQRADLVAWHRGHVSPKNAVLLVVSGKKPAALRPALESAFGGWRGQAVQEPAAPGPEPAGKGIQIRVVDVPGTRQAQVRVGRLGIAHRDPDFYAATVANQILGAGGEQSRLGRAIRKTYPGQAAATTSFDRNLDRGAFVAAGVAPTGQALAVMRLFMEQIGQMAAEGPREDEVRRAVTELVGSYATRLASNQEIGSALLAAELHGFGPDYVRDFPVKLGEVNAAAVRASAARMLDGKNLTIVLAGNAQELEPQLAEAGLRYDKVAAAGSPRPSEGQAVAVEDPKKAAAARAVLDAALAAKGGAGRLAGVKSLSWKGKATLNLQGGQVPAQVERRFLAPDKLRLDMVIEAGGSKMSVTTVLAGDKGWAQENRADKGNLIDFPPSEVEAGKAQVWRDQDFVLLRHREKGAVVTPLDDVDRDGAPHHAVQVTSADGKRTVTLYIDKKRKRLTGMAYTDMGMSAEETFGDFKTVNGIEIAHQRTTKSAQVDLTMTVTNVTINPPLKSSLFDRPADAAPAATPGPAQPAPGSTPAKPGAAPAKPGSTPGAAPAQPTPAKPGSTPTKPGSTPGAAPAQPAPGSTPAKPSPGGGSK